jgi:hypothetical protein
VQNGEASRGRTRFPAYPSTYASTGGELPEDSGEEHAKVLADKAWAIITSRGKSIRADKKEGFVRAPSAPKRYLDLIRLSLLSLVSIALTDTVLLGIDDLCPALDACRAPRDAHGE